MSTAAPPLALTAPPCARRPQPRRQYVELKANVHRKLLNRLNLEALAQADRSRAEGEIRALLGELLAGEATPLSMTERDAFFAEVLDEVFGLGPLEPLLRDPEISDILVNTYRHVFVERGGVLERVEAQLSGRSPSDARHRSHRQRHRPARRRELADGRRAAAGRLARQRHHSAARGGWSAAVDPPLPGRAAQGRRPGRRCAR